MESQDRITFSQYNPDDLESASSFSDMEDSIEELEDKVDQLQKVLRISYAAFVTILAVLFSALSLITTPQSGGSNSSGAIATVFDLESSVELAVTALPWIIIIAVVYFILSRVID